MAFATTNTQTSVFGNKRVTMGDFTCAVGDAAGTITVAGGRVWACFLNAQIASGKYSTASDNYSVSTSGSVTTVTVYPQGDVTAGTFMIVHG